MSAIKGPMLMVGAMGIFAIQDALIKDVSSRVPLAMITLVFGSIGTLVFWIAARQQGLRLFDLSLFRGAVAGRAALEVLATTGVMVSLSLVPLSVFASIMQVMPLVVTLGAALLLGEKVGWRRWLAIGVGFIGVLMILRPGAGFDPYALVPLVTVLAMSMRDLITRKIPPGIPSLLLSGWGFMAVFPSAALLALAEDEVLIQAPALDWFVMTLVALTGVVAYSMLVVATRIGDVSLTTPFRYSRLIFAMMLGIVFFGERPDLLTYIGSALVVGAGLFTLLRERALRRRVAVAET
ncbi:MAG: DMT family transporter [Paracoccaceae bacterium]